MLKFKRLSLCMIVKDEEDCIERCLTSVKDTVDEMVIVDTGSSDRTVEICKSLGARVFHFKWNESFADARNYGLEKATGDWILWLDADEELAAEDQVKLRDVLYFDEYDMLNIKLINYYGSKPHDDNVLMISHNRLFRNGMGFRFVNNIHERVNTEEVMTNQEQQERIGMVPIKVYHYGYLDSLVNKKGKSNRNTDMLLKELERDEQNGWIHYHLATEYYRIDEYEKAFDYCNSSIVKFISAMQTPPPLLYKLKYSILLRLGSFDSALEGIRRAIILYPDYVDLQFYEGVILFCKERYEEAIEAFEKCLAIGEENLNHLIQKGLGSFHAWYYKGVCHEKLDQVTEAIAAYEQSLALASFEPAADALKKLQAGIRTNEKRA